MDKKIIVESLKGNLKALKDITGAERVDCWIFEDGRVSGFGASGQGDARVFNLDFYEPEQGQFRVIVKDC